jgi:uncharacterized protein with HEPN domain
MSVNDPWFRLGHMLDMARAVESFMLGVTPESLAADLKLQLAVIRALQIIGEAAARVDDSFRSAHPELPWKKIVGFRNIVVHVYWEVDLNDVWRIATISIPELIKVLKAKGITDKPQDE